MWNPLAGWLQRSKSWEARARQASLDEIQTDINLFNRYYNPEIQRKTGALIDLGKPTDYLNDFRFSYLPYAKSGFLWLNKYGGVAQDSSNGLKNIYVNTRNKSFMRSLLDAVHEGEHAFRNNPTLRNTIGIPYFGTYSGRFLNSAYRTNTSWKPS